MTPITGRMARTPSASCQSMAMSSTLAPMIRKTDEMSEAITMRDEHLHGVDVRGQVRQERRRRDLLNVGGVLCGDPRDQSCPQVTSDPIGGVGLDDALEVAKDEDACRRQEESRRDRSQDERPPAVAVDRVGDELGDEQVQRVSGNRQPNEGGNRAAVGDEQCAQAPTRRRRGDDCGVDSVVPGFPLSIPSKWLSQSTLRPRGPSVLAAFSAAD